MNYYEILKINQNASQKEIKEAYKSLIKKYHPDIYRGDKTFAENKTKQINEAYNVLSNEELKKQYDEEINPTPTYNYSENINIKNSKYSYDNYNKNKENFDYYDYEARRYTNYHRSKTPYSNYSVKNDFNDAIVNKINKMTLTNKIRALIIVILIYLLLLLISFVQISAIFSDETSNTVLDSKNSYNYNNNSSTNKASSNKEDDINSYISDQELYNLYKKYYSDQFSSFYEFKQAVSDLLKDY